MQWNWSVDGWIMLAGALCAVASSLLGNFLILRRLSLMGDAISHSVLPGIAAAYLFTGSRSSLIILAGAAVMGLITVWLTEMIRRVGKVEENAAIGVVFTSLFALGLVMMVRAGDKIDLDPSCVLYGNLETVVIDTVATPFGQLPRVIITLGCICLLNLAAVILFYKQWQISTFDPLLAQAQGVHPAIFHYLLASLVAVTCIASFEAVGNILVVAMLVVPAASGLLLCNRLPSMILVSALIAALSAVVGHLSAIAIPAAFGFRTVNSAAMIAVACGVILTIIVVISPKGGVLVKWFAQQRVARKIVSEDVLAILYRHSERFATTAPSSQAVGLTVEQLASQLTIPSSKLRSAIVELTRTGWIAHSAKTLSLTEQGSREAQNLVRSHRLWEQYLSVELKVPDERLHTQAESLEHFTNSSMRGKLDQETGKSAIDPHGRSIPPEG